MNRVRARLSAMRLLPALLGGAVLALGCQSTSDAARKSDADRLAVWMTGKFSSAAQAEAAPEDYFDISLVMIPIWERRNDGPWLYVEQAAANALERPYRQRVYHLVDTAEGVRSDVYLLPGDPLELAGATSDRFEAFGPEALVLREGCSIFMAEEDGVFVGATRGKGCASTLGGASYATSEVRVERDVLTSWDRGFDANEVQVWGAELGAYVFVREP